MTGAGNALEPSPFNAIGDSLGKRWLRSVRRQTGWQIRYSNTH